MPKKKQEKDIKNEKKTKKAALQEAKKELEDVANRIALKKMTELQLATQAPISDVQKQAIDMLASGLRKEEAAELLYIDIKAIESWMNQSNFVMALNESTIKKGASDKNERVRHARRMVESIQAKIVQKITDNDELDKMPLSVLNKMMLEWSERLDKLVDGQADKAGKQDLTVLILNHIQANNGKKYNKIDDFLNDEEFKYPTYVDAEFEEVKNEGQQ